MLLRLASLALVLWARTAGADVSAPSSWATSCGSAVKRALATQPALAGATVKSARTDVAAGVEAAIDAELADGRLTIALAPTGEGTYPEALEWEEDPSLLRVRQAHPVPFASMSTAGGYATATGATLVGFLDRLLPAVRSCLDSARRRLETPAYTQWRLACSARIHAALASASAQDPIFTAANVDLLGRGIGIALRDRDHQRDRYRVQLAIDVPISRGWIAAWSSAIGDCADAHTGCEMLRAPGYVGYVVADQKHRRGFVESIIPAVRACMTQPPPR